MNFKNEQIEQARRFRQLGLAWEPQAGHYVYDETGFCKRPSPFQDRVFFILNYDYFINRVGGLDEFKRIMLWLPTWYDCREVLQSFGIASEQVSSRIETDRAIVQDNELSALYDMIEQRLVAGAKSDGPVA